MSSDGGKGSASRPALISNQQFSDNWDKIFGKREPVTMNQKNTYCEGSMLMNNCVTCANLKKFTKFQEMPILLKEEVKSTMTKINATHCQINDWVYYKEYEN